MKTKKRLRIPTKYLRELSIVIIGVLITLFITNIISGINKQQEIKNTLEMIQEEMSTNLASLNFAEKKWHGEKSGYDLILKNIDQINAIPVDTLETLRKIIGDKHALSVKQDAYEVFKVSSLMQFIREKNFLRELSECYGKLEEINQKLLNYSNIKGNGITHLMNTTDLQTVNKWMSGSIYDYFQVPFSNNAFRIFVYSGGSILSVQDFEDGKVKITELIRRIEQKKY